MKIGDKVRFLNDIGGGKVTAFRPGGIVLVEDEDGFDIPVPMDQVVVVETNALNIKKKPAPKVEYGAKPAKDEPSAKDCSINGQQYLASKSGNSDLDALDREDLEGRIIKLELTVRQLLQRIERLEDAKAAKEKEKIMARQAHKKAKDEIIEIDLHASELLDTTAGMSPNDIKEYQLGVFKKTMNEHISEKGRKIVFIHGKGEGVLRKALIDELKYSYKTCEYQDASFQQYGFGATMVIIH